jgi:hypothetical protein
MTLKSFVNMSLDSYFTLFLSKSLFLAFNIVMAFGSPHPWLPAKIVVLKLFYKNRLNKHSNQRDNKNKLSIDHIW